MANQQDTANDTGTGRIETPRAEQSQSSPAPAGRPYGADDVARRAYERFLGRGGTHGHDMDDWFEAERELRAQNAGEAAAPPHGDALAAASVAQRAAAPKGKGTGRRTRN